MPNWVENNEEKRKMAMIWCKSNYHRVWMGWWWLAVLWEYIGETRIISSNRDWNLHEKWTMSEKEPNVCFFWKTKKASEVCPFPPLTSLLTPYWVRLLDHIKRVLWFHSTMCTLAVIAFSSFHSPIPILLPQLIDQY
jgi:hypothetical protein